MTDLSKLTLSNLRRLSSLSFKDINGRVQRIPVIDPRNGSHLHHEDEVVSGLAAEGAHRAIVIIAKKLLEDE